MTQKSQSFTISESRVIDLDPETYKQIALCNAGTRGIMRKCLGYIRKNNIEKAYVYYVTMDKVVSVVLCYQHYQKRISGYTSVWNVNAYTRRNYRNMGMASAMIKLAQKRYGKNLYGYGSQTSEDLYKSLKLKFGSWSTMFKAPGEKTKDIYEVTSIW